MNANRAPPAAFECKALPGRDFTCRGVREWRFTRG